MENKGLMTPKSLSIHEWSIFTKGRFFHRVLKGKCSFLPSDGIVHGGIVYQKRHAKNGSCNLKRLGSEAQLACTNYCPNTSALQYPPIRRTVPGGLSDM